MAAVAPIPAPLADTSQEAVKDIAKFLSHALQLHADFPDRATVLNKLQQLSKCGGTAIQRGVEEDQRLLREALDAVVPNVNMQTMLSAYTPSELCVFRASLLHASEQLSSESANLLVSLRSGLDATIENAMQGPAREALTVALHGEAALLRATVMSAMDAKEDVKRVGQSLYNMLSSHNLLTTTLSNESREALRRMAEWAAPLPAWAVAELQNSKALAICVTHCSQLELLELRDAIGRAASSGVAVELMSLWSAVHETIGSTLSPEAVAALATTVSKSVEPMQEALSSSTQEIGKLLLLALSSSMGLASAVSVELQDAVRNMAEHGVPLPSVAHLREELEANAALIAQALPAEKLMELETHVRQAASTEWSEVTGFASELKQAVASLPPVPTVFVDALKNATVDVVYGNAFSAAILNGDYGKKLDDFFLQSRESVHEAVMVMANGLSSTTGWLASLLATLPPLLRVEILRDFCQTISLFFTNLYGAFLSHKDSPFLRGTLTFFRNVFNIVSADFTALWSGKREQLIDIGFALLLGVIMLTYVAYLWFAFSGRHLHKRSEEIRHGHEALSWAALATKQQFRLRVFTAVITLCLSVYLPLTRVSLEIISATIARSQFSAKNVTELVSPSTLTILERYSDIQGLWMILQIGSVLLLVTFTLPLPFLLMRAIAENKPTGSPENPLVTYDLDGEQVPFDDKIYSRLVATDPSQLRCPYRSLYAGFEQKWSHYKVFQLLFKVVLIVPLILTRQRGIRSILTSVIYSLIVGLTSYGTPFNDPLNNIMEVSGKMTALVTCVGGVLLAFMQSNERVQIVVGLVVNIVNAVNLIVMVGIMLFGMKKTRIWIKNRLGTLTFSDTTRDIQDAPAVSIIPQWDLEKEAKHRLWHHFWHSLLLSLPEQKEIIERLGSLQHAVTASGVENVKRHWQGQADSYTACMRMAARRSLEGIDVFWDDASGARDGFLDSQSCFGKMYIHPYPFHCVVVYDDSKDESIIRDDKFAAFFFRNFHLETMMRRFLRQKLRVLSEGHVLIHFPFSRQETVTVEDGTETVTTTDSEGKSHTTTKTRYTSVEFTCFYTAGVIHVSSSAPDREMSAGFNVTMTYNDGFGDAVAPHTGVTHHQQNRSAVMGPGHVGLTPQMQESPQLALIFQQTQHCWLPGVAQLQERHNQYRMRLIERHTAANQILGDGFWYFVFNNPYLTRAQLHQYLTMEETNPVLRQLPVAHAPALDFLYQRLGFVHAHPACKLWYVFWDDVFARNGEMRRLLPFAQELNPALATSIAYRVMKRDELTAWLKERKLLGHPLSWKTVLLRRRCLFHEKVLQLLYARMQQLIDPNAIPVKPAMHK